MNGDPAHVAHHLSWHMGEHGIDPTEGPSLTEVVKAQRERCKTLVEMVQASRFFYQEFEEYDEKAAKKNFKAGSDQVLQYLLEQFSNVSAWDGERLHQIVLDAAEKLELKLGKVAQPLRVAVSGTAVSPPIDITLSLLGREKTLQRIKKAIDFMQNKNKS